MRAPAHATAQSLLEFPRGAGSRLVLVKMESLSETDARKAVALAQDQHGVGHLDMVLSSAGICRLGRVDELDPNEFLEHANVNAVAVVRLFQATLPLLK